MRTVKIENLAALRRFAKTFAAARRGGEIIGLVGDLGAGKTTFVQMLAKALGVKEAVKSPTFILMQVFHTGPAAKERGIAQLCHVDAYRLKDRTELEAIGFDEYAGEASTLTVVEWADRIPELHERAGFIELTFDFKAETEGRTIIIE